MKTPDAYYVERDLLKKQYGLVLELAFLASLFLMIAVFLFWQKFDVAYTLPAQSDKWEIEVVDIPLTKQLKRPPRPAIPSIPVAEENMDLVEELSISWDNIDLKSLAEAAPPADDVIEEWEFIKVAQKPIIIKKVAPEYPVMARNMGLEGMVVLKVLIGINGRVEKVEVQKSIPMLDEAAIDAVKQFEFRPGRQRDRYVKVWMSIPFHFRLK